MGLTYIGEIMNITEEQLRGFLQTAASSIDHKNIALTANLSDSGLDSLDIYDLIVMTQEHCGIEIPDADLNELKTLESILNYCNKSA